MLISNIHETNDVDYFHSVLDDVQVGDYQLWLDQTLHGQYYLQIRFDDKDNFGSEICTQYCRKWMIEPDMNPNELIRTAYKAYEAAVIHEMQEKFLYKGQAIFNPHRDITTLLDKTAI